MKKKISKLQLKKKVVSVMNQPANRGDGFMATRPAFSCIILCLPTYGCPPPPDTTGP